MEQTLTIDILEEFEKLTQFNVISYLASFQSFIQLDMPNIIGYYSGDISSLNQSSNNNLNILTEQTQELLNTIRINKTSFKNYKWWILLDNIEKSDSLLLKLNTISKWLRSTISNGSFNANPEVDIPFNQGQVLESVQRNILGSDNWDNSWIDLALKNDLREEDYTSDAGFLLKANFNFNLNNFKINTIVDNPIDDRVLGKDLSIKLEYDTVEQDLIVLSPKDTFIQTVTILINLRKGDNPQFPEQGLTPSLVVGSNINSLSYPSIFRQLISLFRTDDTIKEFVLVGIRRESDAVFIDFQVTSRLGDLQKISLAA